MTETQDSTGTARSSSLPALVYEGSLIHERSEMLSLTDMWRAARSPEEKRPTDWLALSSTAQFRDAVEASFNAGKSGIETRRGGKAPGTWAHWQIALAYAKYLSPEFHMWCNRVVRERMEGAPSRMTGLTVSDRSAIGGIVKTVVPGLVAQVLSEALPALAEQLLPAMVANALASKAIMVRRGKTAGQILRDHGFQATGIAGWFSHKLREMGCAIEGGGKAELGLTTAYLYDPDKAEAWMRNGGRVMVERKIAERRGQGVLQLVPRAT